MNKNVENYKKAVDKIEASEDLKESTFRRVQETKKERKINLKQLVAACATFVIVVSAGAAIYNKNGAGADRPGNDNLIADAYTEELPKFESIDQLKEVLTRDDGSRYRGDIKAAGAMATIEDAESENDIADASTSNSSTNYSTTNVQVKGVDEADIVKTDGKNIYYVVNGKLVIVDAEKLELLAEIKEPENSYNSIQEVFIKDKKVIVLGTTRVNKPVVEVEEDPDVRIFGKEDQTPAQLEIKPRPDYSNTISMTTARVYDISNKENPVLEREVGLEGYYNTARMIDNNLYLISNKSVYYYKGSDIKDEDLLPWALDSVKDKNPWQIGVTDISYIEDTKTHSYLLVAGFDLDKNKKADIETVFGASDNVYCSQDNLYVTDSVYNYGYFISDHSTHIYKFKLRDYKLRLVAKGEVKGYIQNQFNMDEYNGYLRIATTGETLLGDDTNNLFILDERLNKVGEITGIAKGELIKSVRFMGKVGYIVTYEQIDPLFVVDLSDPRNPRMRGKLEIPGYSAYLHPYDETHIIGIGFNTRSNDFGNTINSSLKMSMFDVSDLDNPKELFNVDIGTGSSYSEITSNHKALFYYKEKNLIGFPLTTYSYGSTTGFVLYKIDLDKNEFTKYGELKNSNEYWNSVRRIIYIGENIYSLSNNDITKYDLNTAEQKGTLEIKREESKYYYDDPIYIME